MSHIYSKKIEENRSVCDKNNFETIYEKYSKSLFGFIYVKCGDKDRASDLVQEAYIKLWRNCKKVYFEKSKSYLYTVAKNHFLTEEKHKKVVLRYKFENNTDKINVESPEFILEEKEYMKKLESAIGKLTKAQREVFLLSRIEKKKYRDISEMLDISVKAVEKRMHGALLLLNKELKRKI